MLDTSSLSVLSVTDSICSSKSSIISLAVQSFPNFYQESDNSSAGETGIDSVEEAVFVLTRDAHMVLMDSTTGTLISSQPIHPKENSVAVSLNFLGKYSCLSIDLIHYFVTNHPDLLRAVFVQNASSLSLKRIRLLLPSSLKFRISLCRLVLEIKLLHQELKMQSILIGKTRVQSLKFCFVARMLYIFTLRSL